MGGYAYPYIREDILREALLYLSELMIFSYGFNTLGDLIAPDDEWLIQEALNYGVAPIMVLTPIYEGRFNNYLVNQVVENPSVAENLIDQILQTVEAKGYAGVDVDFEYILPEDREGYAAFIRDLTERMNAQGYRVSVALAPKTSAEQRGVLYEGMDYRLLGEYANWVFLMTCLLYTSDRKSCHGTSRSHNRPVRAYDHHNAGNAPCHRLRKRTRHRSQGNHRRRRDYPELRR